MDLPTVFGLRRRRGHDGKRVDESCHDRNDAHAGRRENVKRCREKKGERCCVTEIVGDGDPFDPEGQKKKTGNKRPRASPGKKGVGKGRLYLYIAAVAGGGP